MCECLSVWGGTIIHAREGNQSKAHGPFAGRCSPLRVALSVRHQGCPRTNEMAFVRTSAVIMQLKHQYFSILTLTAATTISYYFYSFRFIPPLCFALPSTPLCWTFVSFYSKQAIEEDFLQHLTATSSWDLPGTGGSTATSGHRQLHRPYGGHS